MTRAAVCVMGADPFLNAYWLRNSATWIDQVDELRVIACGLDSAYQPYLWSESMRLNTLVHWSYAPAGTDHGVAIHQALARCEADVVMLCEEDAYVRRPGAVAEQFARIESREWDIVGGPRGTMSAELRDWANRKFGELTGETGEAGPILWPCFLWARRTDLERTDRHYGAIGWEPGTSILGQSFGTAQAADTFGWASLQLRNLGLRVHPVAQYRVDLAAMGNWTDPPWFHVGGLSTGWGMYVLGPVAHTPAAMAGQNLTDWSKRIAWWRRMAAVAPGPEPLRAPYRAGIDQLVTAMGMDEDQIAAWAAQYERLVTWPE